MGLLVGVVSASDDSEDDHGFCSGVTGSCISVTACLAFVEDEDNISSCCAVMPCGVG